MSNCAHVFIFLPFRYNRNYQVNTINVKTWLRKKQCYQQTKIWINFIIEESNGIGLRKKPISFKKPLIKHIRRETNTNQCTSFPPPENYN